MKKVPLTLLFVLAMMLFVLVAPAAADNHLPGGSCPAGFDDRHAVGEHEGEFHEHHIGVTVDLNNNGYICVKHLEKSGLHVHADDFIP